MRQRNTRVGRVLHVARFRFPAVEGLVTSVMYQPFGFGQFFFLQIKKSMTEPSIIYCIGRRVWYVQQEEDEDEEEVASPNTLGY